MYSERQVTVWMKWGLSWVDEFVRVYLLVNSVGVSHKDRHVTKMYCLWTVLRLHFATGNIPNMQGSTNWVKLLFLKREVHVAPPLLLLCPISPLPRYDYALCIGYIHPGVLLGFYFNNLFMLYVFSNVVYIFVWEQRALNHVGVFADQFRAATWSSDDVCRLTAGRHTTCAVRLAHNNNLHRLQDAKQHPDLVGMTHESSPGHPTKQVDLV